MKLLPFDNKAELRVVVDLKEGSSVEDTDRALQMIVNRLARIPEIVSFETYAGTAAPFNFNGLVRHYYLRSNPDRGSAGQSDGEGRAAEQAIPSPWRSADNSPDLVFLTERRSR